MTELHCHCRPALGYVCPIHKNKPRPTLNLDMEPIVPAEAPVLLRHHLALAARLFEILPAGADADALVDGMEEPGRQAAREFLISLSGCYNLEDDGD